MQYLKKNKPTKLLSYLSYKTKFYSWKWLRFRKGCQTRPKFVSLFFPQLCYRTRKTKNLKFKSIISLLFLNFLGIKRSLTENKSQEWKRRKALIKSKRKPLRCCKTLTPCLIDQPDLEAKEKTTWNLKTTTQPPHFSHFQPPKGTQRNQRTKIVKPAGKRTKKKTKPKKIET